MSHRKRKHPKRSRRKHAARAARLATLPPATPPATILTRAPRLLDALATALNDLDHAGLRVKFAWGGAVTDAGYVLRLPTAPRDPSAGERWQVRTPVLTEFAATEGDDLDS